MVGRYLSMPIFSLVKILSISLKSYFKKNDEKNALHMQRFSYGSSSFFLDFLKNMFSERTGNPALITKRSRPRRECHLTGTVTAWHIGQIVVIVVTQLPQHCSTYRLVSVYCIVFRKFNPAKFGIILPTQTMDIWSTLLTSKSI